MGYFYLGLSLLAGVTKGFCGKKTSGIATGFRDAARINVLRMLLCMAVGLLFVFMDGGIDSLRLDGSMLLFAAAAGASTAIFAVTWLLTVRVGAYMLVDVALVCSVFVPIFGSLVLFGETVSPLNLVGLALLIAAVILMYLYNNQTKAKLSALAALLLIICFLSSGFSDFFQKLYVANDGGSVAAFGFYTYVFAFITLLLFYLGLSFFQKEERKEPFKLTSILPYITVMAVCMFLASYFQTLAAQDLQSSVLYPLARGGALILSAVMSRICLREKWTFSSLLGIALTLAGILVMNA